MKPDSNPMDEYRQARDDLKSGLELLALLENGRSASLYDSQKEWAEASRVAKEAVKASLTAFLGAAMRKDVAGR